MVSTRSQSFFRALGRRGFPGCRRCSRGCPPGHDRGRGRITIASATRRRHVPCTQGVASPPQCESGPRYLCVNRMDVRRHDARAVLRQSAARSLGEPLAVPVTMAVFPVNPMSASAGNRPICGVGTPRHSLRRTSSMLGPGVRACRLWIWTRLSSLRTAFPSTCSGPDGLCGGRGCGSQVLTRPPHSLSSRMVVESLQFQWPSGVGPAHVWRDNGFGGRGIARRGALARFSGCFQEPFAKIRLIIECGRENVVRPHGVLQDAFALIAQKSQTDLRMACKPNCLCTVERRTGMKVGSRHGQW